MQIGSISKVHSFAAIVVVAAAVVVVVVASAAAVVVVVEEEEAEKIVVPFHDILDLVTVHQSSKKIHLHGFHVVFPRIETNHGEFM